MEKLFISHSYSFLNIINLNRNMQGNSVGQ